MFDQEKNCVQGVPTSWIITTDNGHACHFPKNISNIFNLIKKCSPPGDWPVYSCIIKKTADCYLDMIEFEKEVTIVSESQNNTSDEGDDEEQLELLPVSKRRNYSQIHKGNPSRLNFSSPLNRPSPYFSKTPLSAPSTSLDMDILLKKMDTLMTTKFASFELKLNNPLIDLHSEVVQIREELKVINKRSNLSSVYDNSLN